MAELNWKILYYRYDRTVNGVYKTDKLILNNKYSKIRTINPIQYFLLPFVGAGIWLIYFLFKIEIVYLPIIIVSPIISILISFKISTSNTLYLVLRNC